MAQTQTRARQAQQQPPQAAPNTPPATRQANAAAPARDRQREMVLGFISALQSFSPRIAEVLPPEIPIEHFRRVAITAVNTNPDLLYADRQSLFNSLVKAASDGLLPDGREGALVVYNTEVKRRNENTGLDVRRRVDMVQWMPMVAGIRKRMRNTGEVLSAVAEAVWSNDKFRYSLGDNPYIEHEPPPLAADRGQVIGAYAIIRLSNGEVIRDVMGKQEIEAARKTSRAPNSPMWTNFYWEGAKKTVLRRASKQAPLSPTMRRLFEREDDEHEDAAPAALESPTIDGTADEVEPEPQPPMITNGHAVEQDDRPTFAVVDVDGVESTFRSAERACEFIQAQLTEAAKLGLPQLEGFWETNQATVEALSAPAREGALAAIFEYDRLCSELRQAAAEAPDRPVTPAQDRPGAVGETRSGDASQPQPQPQPETRPAEAAAATAAQEPAGPAPTEAQGSAPDGNGERQSLNIPMVMRKGEPDARTWTVALFLPKLRRQLDTVSLAFLLGDNEENIELAKGRLSNADRQELEQAIDHQWAQVKQAEAAAANG